MGRNQRNIIILGAAVIILLIVGYYFLLLSPIWTRYDATAQERSDKEAQLQQLQQEVAQLEEIKDNAPTIERQLLELSKRIPTQPEIPTLVVQIEEIATLSGVTQVSIVPGAPGPPPSGGNFSVLPVTMSFEGTYDQLQDFLLRTRKLARLVTVKNVAYQQLEEETEAASTGAEPMLQVELEAEVYFQPLGVPSGTAPVAPTSPETTAPAGGEATGAAAGGETVAQ